MQYICAFTEIELEVIFWQQGIGSVLLPEKNHHPAGKQILDIREIQKNSRSVKLNLLREVILWIRGCCFTFAVYQLTLDLAWYDRRYSQPLLFWFIWNYFIYISNRITGGDFFCRFEPGKPGGSRKISGGHFVCGIFMYVF